MRQFLAGLGGSSGAFAAAGVIAALVAAGYWVQSTRNAVVEEAVTAAIAAMPEDDAPAADAVEAPQSEELVAVAETPAETSTAVEEAAVAPTFDEVRREADGVTVIAGEGSPGAKISVLKNGEVVASATADAAGKFATIALIPPDGQGHILTLLQASEGKELASLDEIILAPMAAPVETAEVAPEVETVEEVAEAQPADEALSAEEEVVAAVEEAPAATEKVVAEEATTEDEVAETVVAETPEPKAEAPVEVVEAAPAQSEETVAEVADEVEAPQPAETAPVVAEVAETVEVVEVPETTEVAETEETVEVADIAEVLDEAADVASEETPSDDAPVQIAALSEEGETPQVTPAPVQPSVAEEVQAPKPEAEATAPATQEVAVLKSTQEGVELLNTQAPEVLDNVAIDTISYSDVGDVQLTGRAQSEATAVRVYLDNDAVLDFPVDADGRWRGELPDVDEGIYTLRVDEVAADGQVTSRVETPFKREAPEVLAQATDGLDGPIKAITVQKGATLWAIARERYGEGELYVRVFEANRDAIRNPDLIYPGQIFDLPD